MQNLDGYGMYYCIHARSSGSIDCIRRGRHVSIQEGLISSLPPKREPSKINKLDSRFRGNNDLFKDSLMEYDKLNIEDPDIQKYISQNADRDEEYFYSEERLSEDIFYKAKSLVYKQLNMFDELLATSASTGGLWNSLFKSKLIEQTDWDVYIKVKLRHPFYRSILKKEAEIFGESLRNFLEDNASEIESNHAKPFVW